MENPLDKKFKSLTPACYGCVYACASPVFLCEHPLSIRLSYDGFTRRCYRFPSFELCLMNKGLCNFYEPSKERGAEYFHMQEEMKETKKTLEETMEAYSNLASRLKKEGEKSDEAPREGL